MPKNACQGLSNSGIFSAETSIREAENLPSTSKVKSIPVDAPERPSVDTRALNAFLESIKSFNREFIFGLGPNDSLFHYTDLQGLLGIVSDHDLRLTHSLYLNDAEEMIHGSTVAEQVIVNARKGKRGKRWNSYLDQLTELLKQPLPEGVYICCFCQKDNLLSQWRSYGANGSGVSIRFNPHQFYFVTGPDSPHGGMMRLWKVFYLPAQQVSILNSAVNFAFQHPPAGKTSTAEMARQAADAIQFFIPTFKNADFVEESEWRLIFTPPAGCSMRPKFRASRGGMLVPYYSLKELCGGSITPSGLPITGLCIGPSVNQALNKQSARMFLTQASYTGVEPIESKTPYRG